MALQPLFISGWEQLSAYGGSRCLRIRCGRHPAQPPPCQRRAHRRAGNDERQACLVGRQPASNLL